MAYGIVAKNALGQRHHKSYMDKMKLNFSLKTTAITSIIVMGILVISAVLMVDKKYRHFSLDSQNTALEQITELQTLGVLAELEKLAVEMGHTLRSDAKLLSALKDRDMLLVDEALESHYLQYFISTGLIDVKNLAVYDKSMNYIHHTPANEEEREKYGSSACGDMLVRAAARTGADRLKVISSICNIQKQVHLSVLVPLDGLRGNTYLEILTDPVLSLRKLENALGLPMKLHDQDGNLRYASAIWPRNTEIDKTVIAKINIETDDNQVGLRISVALDVVGLQDNMRQTRTNILTIAIITTAIFIGLILFLLEKTFFSPLSRLGDSLRNVSHESGQFSGTLPILGNSEIRGLTEHFNEMLITLHESYSNLENANTELESHRDQLENEVSKRTADLELARDEALQASRTKSQFLANMSHELRTPLNAIIGYSEMLIEDLSDENNPDAVTDIRKVHIAGKHLLSLINDVLDLSKIEAGKMDIYVEKFSIGKIVGELRDTIEPLVTKNGNQLVISCPVDIGYMNADITKLRQALFNILSNASKFTSDGKVILEVSRYDELGTEYISFSVIDEGIGINTDQLTKLFKAFSQADASTTRRFGGTGLGLVISRHFCRMMGGDISVSSEVNKGSTFTIFLPAEVQQNGDKTAPAYNEDLDTEELDPQRLRLNLSSPKQGNERRRYITKILVIDDDPTVRDLLSRFLKKEGFDAYAAHSGWKGMEVARKYKPDVIILDVMMPELDGWTVLSKLKKDVELKDIPIILLTMVDDKKMGFALGATDYMTKPIVKTDLLVSIRKIIRQKPDQTILVVEDEADIREMVSRMLKREGWKTSTAANGKEALDYMEQETPGLILLDLMMPEMDGFEFITNIKVHPVWREIPIIVLTAMDLTAEDRLFLQSGTQYVLEKGAYATKDLLGMVHNSILKFIRKDQGNSTTDNT